MFSDGKIKYLGFGSPLMDMITDVDDEMLKKYNLTLDTTIHQKLTESNVVQSLEKETTPTYVAGGCSYNAMRVFNWMLENRDENQLTGLLGSIGDDFYGDLYAELLQKEKIEPIFEKYDHVNTGICCVFCHDRDRGHITDLGASTLISAEFVQRIWEQLKNVQLIYTELFILKHRKNIVYLLAENALSDHKLFGFNLPSSFFIENYFHDILNLIEYADILFANAAEAVFFASLLGLMKDNTQEIQQICIEMAKIPKKNKNKKRVVVITCGPNPAFVAEYDFINEKLTFFDSFTPEYIEESLIVDTNGAGDAFAGGFLSRFVQNQSIQKCMNAGHWAASVIIQTRGCQIPEQVTYNSSDNYI